MSISDADLTRVDRLDATSGTRTVLTRRGAGSIVTGTVFACPLESS